MSQVVGVTYKSKIPSLGDDATIEEALRVYHYGVDNRTSEPIPDDSIEGNFRTLASRITTLEGQYAVLGTTYVESISQAASPNVITGANTTTIPITVRAISLQTAALQSWQNSSSTPVATMTTGGYLSIAGYANIGSTTQSTTTGLGVTILDALHKGITIKGVVSQSANLQEWQNSSGTAISWVDSEGRLYSQGDEVGGAAQSFFLLGV